MIGARRLPRLLAAVLCAAAPCVQAAAEGAGPPTPAELCGYRCTPGYRETIDYIGTLTKLSPDLKLFFYGESASGYPLPAVVAAKGKLADPENARAAGRPVILIFSGIHAGEIAGKDASLILLREIATGKRADLLDKLVVIVAPIYNVDGHERVSPNNRLAQDGPVEGMGFRTNGRGLDLNRDFLKMESPETEALVGKLYRAWRPQVVLDCHVTDGMDFQYDMTYFAGEGLNAPRPLRAYVGRLKKAIGAGLAGAGYKSAPFWDLTDPADPGKGVTTFVSSPRFSTSYFETRNSVSLLAEAHAHKPFERRVGATLAMIHAILDEAAADPGALLEAVAGAAAETVKRAGSGYAFTLSSESNGEAEMVDYLGYTHVEKISEVTGDTRVVWTKEPVTWKVPLYAAQRPVRQARLPRGYLLDRAYGHLARKAYLHGLRVERTLADADVEVETYRIGKMTRAEASFQGHHNATAEGKLARETRRIPAGTYWIPLGQPDAAIAVWMFEPESPDGLLSWNYFDNVLERKMVVEKHVLESMAAAALEDPSVRREYEAALATDSGLAGDPNARLWWFYERSPYFDSQVGLFPVFRVDGDLGTPTAAWSPQDAR